MRLAQTMIPPERLERRFSKSSEDFGRLGDVSTLSLETLLTHPNIIIDTTGQLGTME
jgi:hypothetical protein